MTGWGRQCPYTYRVEAQMRINEKGRNLIKSFEGLKLESYRCPAGIWTIGHGSTTGVKPGMVITPGEAERLLDKDLERFERGVEAMLCGCDTSDDEYAALVSIAFNIGLANLATSTLLKRHKLGNKVGAANAFLMWNKARNPRTGKLQVLAGLNRRREAEAALYRGELA